ncbi:MAG TPA: hypothetical protein VHH88_00415 [Verrucomicrobiae bacterium]|nr:hypothetical protein [Verrucomicrobiae bacterium]
MTETDLPPQTTNRRRGCLFYGCLVVAFCGLLTLAGLIIGGIYAKNMLERFTDSAPAPLPKVEMPAAQAEELHKRVNAFSDAVRSAQPTEPLVLNSDELNELVATDPDLRQFKGKVFLQLEGDKIHGQISLPMEQLGLPLFHGRYLNSTGTFLVSLHKGTLRLSAEELSVKGKPVPDKYMRQIRSVNLAQDLDNDPHASAGLNRLKSIEIKDSKLIITPEGT